MCQRSNNFELYFNQSKRQINLPVALAFTCDLHLFFFFLLEMTSFWSIFFTSLKILNICSYYS